MTRRSLLISLASICILVLVASLGASERTFAQSTFTVNSTADAVDENPGDGACATLAGQCTLRAAVQETNALPGADNVRVPAGTYVLGIPGGVEDASLTGDLDVRDDLTISGAGSGRTVIDGAHQDRVLHVAGTTVQVSGVTIRNGSVSTDLHGGGILNTGTLTVSESAITGNAAHPDEGHGGGAYNAGTMTVTNSTVSGNTAFLLGGLGSINTLTVVETTITGNTVRGFAETFAGAGIGVLNGSLAVTDSVISGNSTPNGAPGGIGVLGDATISGSTISDNSAGGVLFGGGVAHGNGRIEITNSTISGNSSAGFGGGIAAGGAMVLSNVTISGNTAASDGGGIAATGTTSLNNVTVTNNTADSNSDGIGDGGGISTVADPVTISNTIVAGNIDRGGEQPDCNKNGLLVSQGYNLVQHTAGCPFVSGVGDITGQDPRLGRLANNGGRTLTHALLGASPAIDSGHPTKPSGAPTCEGTDQRGVSRPQDGNGDRLARCDIGAYERRAERVEIDGVVELPVEFQVVNSNTSGAACPADNGQYTLGAKLVGPESVIYGPGPRAITVYVHGFSSSEPNWAFKLVDGYDLPVELAKLGHVSLNINRLGYSPSDHTPGMMSCMGTAADVLHQIVGQLRNPGAALPDGERAGFSKVVIAGHDSGGTIVEVEAYSYKDIDGLFVTAFADTGFSETVTEWSIGAGALCLQGGQPSDQGAPNYHTFPPMTDEEFANDEALLRRIFYNTDEDVFQAVKQAIATGGRQLNPCGDLPSVPGAVASNLARLHEIAVPVLYLLGDHDIAFTEEGGRRQGGLYSGSRDVTSVIMEETPHFWMWGRTAPEARRILSDWLCTRAFVSAGVTCATVARR
jgi:CSLREA domain-containing protein